MACIQGEQHQILYSGQRYHIDSAIWTNEGCSKGANEISAREVYVEPYISE